MRLLGSTRGTLGRGAMGGEKRAACHDGVALRRQQILHVRSAAVGAVHHKRHLRTEGNGPPRAGGVRGRALAPAGEGVRDPTSGMRQMSTSPEAMDA